MAYNCYSTRFRAALEDFRAKRISRAELDARYAEVKSGLAEASSILGQPLGEADRREAEYRQVLQAEAKKASRPVPPVQTVAATSKKAGRLRAGSRRASLRTSCRTSPISRAALEGGLSLKTATFRMPRATLSLEPGRNWQLIGYKAASFFILHVASSFYPLLL